MPESGEGTVGQGERPSKPIGAIGGCCCITDISGIVPITTSRGIFKSNAGPDGSTVS